jgi:hypothetical protein
MLDPIHCSQLPQHDRPTIALEALLGLAELIEAHGLPSSASDSQSGPSLLRGGSDAPRTEKRLSSTKAGL